MYAAAAPPSPDRADKPDEPAAPPSPKRSLIENVSTKGMALQDRQNIEQAREVMKAQRKAAQKRDSEKALADNAKNSPAYKAAADKAAKEAMIRASETPIQTAARRLTVEKSKQPNQPRRGFRQDHTRKPTKLIAERDSAVANDANEDRRKDALARAVRKQAKADKKAAEEAAHKKAKADQFAERFAKAALESAEEGEVSAEGVADEKHTAIAAMIELMQVVRCDTDSEQDTEQWLKNMDLDSSTWIRLTALFMKAVMAGGKFPRRTSFEARLRETTWLPRDITDNLKTFYNAIYDRLKRVVSLATFVLHYNKRDEDHESLRNDTRDAVRTMTLKQTEDGETVHNRMFMYQVFHTLMVFIARVKNLDIDAAAGKAKDNMAQFFSKSLHSKLNDISTHPGGNTFWEMSGSFSELIKINSNLPTLSTKCVGIEEEQECCEDDDGGDAEAVQVEVEVDGAEGAAAEGDNSCGPTFSKCKPTSDVWADASELQRMLFELLRLMFCNSIEAGTKLSTIPKLREYLLLTVIEESEDVEQVKEAIAKKEAATPQEAAEDTEYSELAACLLHCEHVWGQFLNLQEEVQQDTETIDGILQKTTNLLEAISSNAAYRTICMANVYNLVMSVQATKAKSVYGWSGFNLLLSKFLATFTGKLVHAFEATVWGVLQRWESIAPFESISALFMAYNINDTISTQEPFSAPITTGTKLPNAIFYHSQFPMPTFHKQKDEQRASRHDEDEVVHMPGVRHAAECCVVMFRPGKKKGKYLLGLIVRMVPNPVSHVPVCRIADLRGGIHNTAKFVVVEDDKIVKAFRGDTDGDATALKLRESFFSAQPEQMNAVLRAFYLGRILMIAERNWWKSHIRDALMVSRKEQEEENLETQIPSNGQGKMSRQFLGQMQSVLAEKAKYTQKLHVSGLHLQQYFNTLKTLLAEMFLFGSNEKTTKEQREIIRFWMQECKVMEMLGLPGNAADFAKSNLTPFKFQLLMSHTDHCTQTGIMPKIQLGKDDDKIVKDLNLNIMETNSSKNKKDKFDYADSVERDALACQLKLTNTMFENSVRTQNSQMCQILTNAEEHAGLTWADVFEGYRTVIQTQPGETTTDMELNLTTTKQDNESKPDCSKPRTTKQGKQSKPDCSILPVSSKLKVPVFSLTGGDAVEPVMKQIPKEIPGFYPYGMSAWALFVKVHMRSIPATLPRTEVMKILSGIKQYQEKKKNNNFLEFYQALLNDLQANFSTVLETHGSESLQKDISKYEASKNSEKRKRKKPTNATQAANSTDDESDDSNVDDESDDRPVSNMGKKQATAPPKTAEEQAAKKKARKILENAKKRAREIVREAKKETAAMTTKKVKHEHGEKPLLQALEDYQTIEDSLTLLDKGKYYYVAKRCWVHVLAECIKKLSKDEGEQSRMQNDCDFFCAEMFQAKVTKSELMKLLWDRLASEKQALDTKAKSNRVLYRKQQEELKELQKKNDEASKAPVNLTVDYNKKEECNPVVWIDLCDSE
jgi:hypothetical protein